ncbi:transporter [Prodigiosinella confusarubida]|uniref:Transporter n=1 Tax=Serratia sp. (strain ATCC 39006) TaxID=104623 RepID=A0A2I5TM46_SERS3|nr:MULTISPECIES: TOBE domain-containing protein [Enterobacterales]WJV59716.1 TOBE domain-containing protein [Pectobacteriaceae bacterium C111]WJY13592.1 TOBE domain-containing protein [Pectobacteriaceae bacterium CE90]AUH01309.1 transporter [Serratia sp. ATCC 39006]AUH05630.1 transporter [Serratia sp. ATCC 39006]WJV55354.1 TOBE domain-containing protein [Prodigiosinella sp. LS101]
MSVSARNQLTGIVSGVIPGAINNEVILTLDGGEQLATVITKASCDSLGLAPGKTAIALIKAPWVILASVDCGLNFSARNQFAGTVKHVIKGAVNSTVHIETVNGLKLTSNITNESIDEMAIAKGSEVIALIKASNVILATPK